MPRGRYVGARWTLGVPFALNHTDAPASPAPLNSTAMTGGATRARTHWWAEST